MEYKYTRITPNGEEKCSLRNGDGMTIEEMNNAISKFCDNWGDCEYGKEVPCPLYVLTSGQPCGGENADIVRNYNILVKAGVIKPPVNFVKANPDDAVESEGDEVKSGLADSETRREFASGAVRDVAEGKGRCDLLPAVAMLRLARHFERGAIKYSDRNWERGIPIHSFIDSAIRHTMKYLDGQHDEDHLCAAAWNLICAMWTEEKHPELNDLPWAKEAEK